MVINSEEDDFNRIKNELASEVKTTTPILLPLPTIVEKVVIKPIEFTKESPKAEVMHTEYDNKVFASASSAFLSPTKNVVISEGRPVIFCK